jgi:hypothetical protein
VTQREEETEECGAKEENKRDSDLQFRLGRWKNHGERRQIIEHIHF